MKLHQKDPLIFSLVWIGVYVAALSIADGISARIGIEKLVTAPLCAAMTVFLIAWLKKNGLLREYGLCRVKTDGRNFLYFLPLLVLISTNLWGGVKLHGTWLETVLYMFSMVCVGILEEVIFRGFLFLALCRENVKRAVIISSLTFGIGHIVNLLNGAQVLPTLLQILYAAAVGFLFTVIFMRTGTLLHCIATHSLVNALSGIGGDRSPAVDMIAAAVMTVVSLGYGCWILKKTKPSS